MSFAPHGSRLRCRCLPGPTVTSCATSVRADSRGRSDLPVTPWAVDTQAAPLYVLLRHLGRNCRTSLTGGPRTVRLGATAIFRTKYASVIKAARLIHPSSTTHVTDVEQRSIALGLKEAKDGKGIQVSVPNNRNLVPAGWYMLFVSDDQGTPSKAQWVKVP